MRRRIALALIAPLALVGASLVVAPPPAASAASTSYYVAAYDGTVWAVTPSTISPLTYSQWTALGSPRPKPAPTQYVKYAWSSTISAVTMFGLSRSRWVWHRLSAAEWARAGSPTPRAAGWIAGSTYYQWAGSSQIFVQDVGGVRHALTYAEWMASGFQPFTKRSNEGFVKLSWNSSIAYLTDFASGKGSPIGYARWSSEGFPAPVVRNRFPGDQVYQNYGSSTLYYAGPTVSKALTYDEWAAMGFPAPAMRNVPKVSTSAQASSVLALTNQQRSVAGVAALRLDSALNAAAQAWANQLASTCTFEHSTSTWRAERTASAGWAATGENIAAGYSTAADVMTAWMNSSGHRANILDSRYRGLGVGYATGACYGTYWVQIFGIPAS